VEKICDGAKKKGRALKWKSSVVIIIKGTSQQTPTQVQKIEKGALVQREKILPNGGDISKQKCFQALTIQNYMKLKY